MALEYRERGMGRGKEAIDKTLIHEMAHVAVEDHLTHPYHNECCRIGARLRSLGAEL